MVVQRDALFDDIPQEFQARGYNRCIGDVDKMLVCRASDRFGNGARCRVSQSGYGAFADRILQITVGFVDEFNSASPRERELLKRLDYLGIELRIERHRSSTTCRHCGCAAGSDLPWGIFSM